MATFKILTKDQRSKNEKEFKEQFSKKHNWKVFENNTKKRRSLLLFSKMLAILAPKQKKLFIEKSTPGKFFGTITNHFYSSLS